MTQENQQTNKVISQVNIKKVHLEMFSGMKEWVLQESWITLNSNRPLQENEADYRSQSK